jgi:predicted lysophospholipase L1 biosynthesis ABC-type transport system permease subunit
VAAVGYRFRAELRARWRSVIALALLAGVAGAVTLAAIAGARRTDTAFARMLRETRAADVLVNPDFGNESGLDVRRVAALPMVAQAAKEQGVSVLPAPIHPTDLTRTLGLALTGDLGYSFSRPHVLHGRMPRADRVDEVLVNPRFADRYGLSVGDAFTAVVVSQQDFETFARQGLSLPAGLARVNRGDAGTRVRLRVTGIGVSPEEVVLDQGFEQRSLVATPAFWRRYPTADAGFFGIGVRLRRGATDLPAFKRAVQALPHQGAIEFQTNVATAAKVDRAVQPSVGALSVFAIVIALTALLVVGQAIARQTFLDSVDHPTLRALGFQRAQLVATSMLRALVVALLAAAVAVVGAIAASPLLPIGAARTAEPNRGISVDAAIVGLGALAVVVAVLALSAASAWWYSRASVVARDATTGRPSHVSAWLRSSGTPVVAATGVRMAVEPGRGRTAVPVRSTVAGAALAIASVAAAVTFAASLDHLVSTPRLYGWSWDVSVDTGGRDAQDAAALVRTVSSDLQRSPLVRAYSTSVISRVDVDGVTVTALGVQPRTGDVGPTIVAGRAPRAKHEIALGAKTLDRIGASLGDTVHVKPDSGGAPVPLRVVGRVVLPGLGTYSGSDKTALGEGALLTQSSLRTLGPDFGAGPFLVMLAPSATRAQLARAIVPKGRAVDVTVSGLERPSDIVSYERVRTTPLVLAGVLALLAIATVAHALVTAVRRRRRDFALLKTLGFTRRQVSGSVAWQATTFGVVALCIGLPVGVIVGRWAWTTLADDLGTVAEPIVPVLAFVIGVPVVLAIANLVAYVPGRIAARLRPAAVLRSE